MSYHPDDIARHTVRSHDPQLEPEFCRPEPDDVCDICATHEGHEPSCPNNRDNENTY